MVRLLPHAFRSSRFEGIATINNKHKVQANRNRQRKFEFSCFGTPLDDMIEQAGPNKFGKNDWTSWGLLY